jgi:hypothetical protein
MSRLTFFLETQTSAATLEFPVALCMNIHCIIWHEEVDT